MLERFRHAHVLLQYVEHRHAAPTAEAERGCAVPSGAPFTRFTSESNRRLKIGGNMFISEFYSRFTSGSERSRLFDALRRLSWLQTASVLPEQQGWPEWPMLDPEALGFQLRTV